VIHSVGTAFAARALAKKLSTEVEGAFLAGMLHDLGKVVLDRFFADYYGDVLDYVRDNEGVTLRAAEKEQVGVTHMKIGGQLADAWKFGQAPFSVETHRAPWFIQALFRSS